MNLKKYAPYIFPLLVFLLVLFLIFRWFQLRNQRANSELNFSEGIPIENLSEDKQDSILRGVGDYDTVKLAPEKAKDASPEGKVSKPQASGVIRYETIDGKVNFSVIVTASDAVSYHVWLHDPDTDELSPAFDLVAGKGGWVGTASLSTDALPVEVVVSTSKDKKDVLNTVVLRGLLDSIPEEKQK